LITDVINYQIIFEAWNRDELINKMKLNSVDLLILNLQMTFLHSSKSIQELKTHFPNMKIILLSLYNQPKVFLNYLEMGINGVVLKHFNSDQILETIDGVMQHGYYYSEVIMKSISLFQSKRSQLKAINFSGTELKIIKGICNEMTSDSMSKKLFLSKRTIDWHRNEVKLKIGAKSTIGVVKYAIAVGLFIL
jgi:DNA-binding NarL/FixJ family response regulator